MNAALVNFLGSTTAAGGAVPLAVSTANPLPVTLSGGIGGLSVAGTVADSSAVAAQFPVTVGGVDYATGFTHRLNTDSTGRLNVNVITGGGSSNVSGTVAAGGSSVGQNPVTTGGVDAGGIVRQMLTDTSGRTIAVGAAVAGTVAVGNPLYVGGVNGSGNVTPIPISNAGYVTVGDNTRQNSIVRDSVTPLGVSATFTSTGSTVGGQFAPTAYPYYTVFVFTDQAGTLFIDCSWDGTTYFNQAQIPIVASTPVQLSVRVVNQIARYRIVNGTTAQTQLQALHTGSAA